MTLFCLPTLHSAARLVSSSTSVVVVIISFLASSLSYCMKLMGSNVSERITAEDNSAFFRDDASVSVPCRVGDMILCGKSSQHGRYRCSPMPYLIRHPSCRADTNIESSTTTEFPPKNEGWYRLLCRGGLVPEAFRLRTRNVRACPTDFCPPEQVPLELDKLCKGIGAFGSR